MQTKRTVFQARLLPYALLAPQLIITLIFFVWPALQAVRQSFMREDPFGLSEKFVWFQNYTRLIGDASYLNSLSVTFVFAAGVTAVSMTVSLLFAVCVNRAIKSGRFYTTMLVWPYALAPAASGLLWWFMFNPSVGLIPYVLNMVGYDWNHRLHEGDAMILIIIAASWKQISYNFLFFVAGLQSVPHSLTEAAAIDGAGPVKRFWTVVFPLLSPTAFFLAVINITYAMFDTLPIIDAVTTGGPSQSTNILVYKVYADGFIGLSLGPSAAQSVVLMLIVVLLTVVQFRWVERKVQY
ncbi:sn-glycerol-3-phosphate ABC transporter permease UgpA [Neorhizobium sp. JUb45]|uniref:sn-glycerol-3-phosphate ABC transporter permease UgpA n=1 Tax=unclassified Neorhizobium TaxID=2629175 RepID=UPI001046D1FB|nr:sn-glycerol-3-phosphate ABC transporter permease UgpA [Neorhizobium sp. JUb45]